MSFDREIKIMAKAPSKCPMCGAVSEWKQVDTSNKGFSVGKAAVGAVLLGPVGLVGGALGKRQPVITVESVDLITITKVNGSTNESIL